MKRNVATILLLLLLTATLAACGKKSGGSSGDGAIPDTPLAGKAGGTDWKIGTGIAKDGGTDGQISLSLSELNIRRECDPFSWPHDKDERSVIFSTEPTVGVQERDLASGKSMTIVVAKVGATPENYIGFGTLELIEVTRAVVKGKLRVKYDDSNSVAGTFEVRRCTDTFADPETVFQADESLDAALVGTWTGANDLGDTYSLVTGADGTVKVTLTTSNGAVIKDYDETWKSDSGTNPKHWRREITKIRTNDDEFDKEGDKSYCAYGVTDGKLSYTCSTQYYPSEFPTEAAAKTYTKAP